jgi:hypothetical protein
MRPDTWRLLKRSDLKRPSQTFVVVFVLDTTGSMGSIIEAAKETVVKMLGCLRDLVGFDVECAFVSYKDFEMMNGVKHPDSGHPEINPWTNPHDEASLTKLQAFIDQLQASGGGDYPEDVAEGLEQAANLFRQLTHKSIRIVYHIADAPGHMETPEKKRFEKAVADLCGNQKAEYVFVDCSSGGCSQIEKMVECASCILEPMGTFVDHVRLGHSVACFEETLASVVGSLAQQALAGPDTKMDLDLITGVDMAVPGTILGSRLARAAAEYIEEELAETRTVQHTPLQNLIQKLQHENFDLVYAAESSIKQGIFASFTHPKHSLQAAALKTMLDSGLTCNELAQAGYPFYVVEWLNEYARSTISLT